MTETPARFPKVQAPFERYEEDGSYVVHPTVKDGFEWVFNRASEVEAIEKLHGTNAAVRVEDSEVVEAAVRNNDRTMATVDPYVPSSSQYVVRGVQNSLSRFSYMENEFSGDGWYFGEVVGPAFHNNPYELDEHLFVPFDWLRRKAEFNSYGRYSVEFDALSNWFEEGLFSLFYSLMHGVQDLSEVSVSNGTFVEGIVFVHPDFDGHIRPSDMETKETDQYSSVAVPLAKLRRDMFPWFGSS